MYIPQHHLQNTDPSQGGGSTTPPALIRSIEQMRPYTGTVRKLSGLQEKAMRKEALAIGAQAGLFEQGKVIDAWLKGRAASLDKTYDFQRLVYPASLHVESRLSGASLLPPIVEKANHYTRILGPQTLHAAQSFYRIHAQARFATVVPDWREYLTQGWPKPDLNTVPRVLLPYNDRERKIWIVNVKRGFALGEQQAMLNFREGLARLQRDFLGMVLYRKLEMQGRIAAPVLAHADEGNTVSAQGRDLRVRAEDLRITRLPVWHPNRYWPNVPWQETKYRTPANLKGHPEVGGKAQ